MTETVRRIYVEKRQGFDVEAKSLLHDLRENLRIEALKGLRLINRYDVSGITQQEYDLARNIIFADPPADLVFDEELPISPGETFFTMEYLPGQFDQREDSAAQCLQILTMKELPLVQAAKVIILSGALAPEELERIKNYCINPVDSREAAPEKPESLKLDYPAADDVAILTGFTSMSNEELAALLAELGLAMSREDLLFCQKYFRDTEGRDPTMTEILLLDTYWSDHCRHTTFMTVLREIEILPGRFNAPARVALEQYYASRAYLYEGEDQSKSQEICLMDIALMSMKELKKRGKLDDLDESDEINACSIVVDAEISGQKEQWLVMFKNETHNHPTEIEPYGGANTCLGGAIRDPLSGRVYVYQGMRLTGSADPRAEIGETLPGKLPQRKITTDAAAGFSAYGNQIGVTAGQVAEVYHPGFMAKRMETGAVIAAAPRRNVNRQKPAPGDIVILLGGKTGRDGCGGATGSSKEHTMESLTTCSAEVQKGNPPLERKIQRLFRNTAASVLIKKCNDFGAGGVSVAIGELTDSLEIDLDAVPSKYDGLDGTELAISESQERMALVVAPENAQTMTRLAEAEGLEATPVATVTSSGRLRMSWRGKTIVDLSREFLNSSGVRQNASVSLQPPDEMSPYPLALPDSVAAALPDLRRAWLANLQDINVCSQKGLAQRFDSTVGAATILMPFGGKYQQTPALGMAALLPVLGGETSTATLMTYGYNSDLATWSPFHGALYAVVETVTKIAALGGDYRKIRLTLQEYFEKLGQDPERWGKPFAALLGAFYAQKKLEIPAIGGKDSMSGTFMDIHVPPTLIAFAVATADAAASLDSGGSSGNGSGDSIVSQEFKKIGSPVLLLRVPLDQETLLPDFDIMKNNFTRLGSLISLGHVLASQTIGKGGLAAALSKMAFGNMIGMEFNPGVELNDQALFAPSWGAIILEMEAGSESVWEEELAETPYILLGTTISDQELRLDRIKISLDEALAAWSSPLEGVFPDSVTHAGEKPHQITFNRDQGQAASTVGGGSAASASASVPTPTSAPAPAARPRVLIPVFPGTNGEYDSAAAFDKVGALTETFIFNNLTPAALEASFKALEEKIAQAQIIMLPGGAAMGDEPAGSGKFIAAVFRNPRIKEAVTEFLTQKGGLILGICNGFQALIKLGLLPYGEIRDLTEDSPALALNNIGRHVSRLARIRITSNLSPWFSRCRVGDIHTIPVAHSEGRFAASEALLKDLAQKGQIAAQYVDFNDEATYDFNFNPSGSAWALESLTSPDGRILGKMGHSERTGPLVALNVPGDKDQQIFAAGVDYFK